MADVFGFDAPQCGDLETLHASPEDKERIEAYFDCDHETKLTMQQPAAETIIISSDEDDEDDNDVSEFFTPMHNGNLPENGRMSVSMICLSEIAMYHEEEEEEEEEETQQEMSEYMANMDIHDDETIIPDEVEVKKCPQQSNLPQKPRRNTNSNLRERSASTSRLANARLTQLSKPKVTNNKYVSLNEAMNRFERGTPVRFHSKPKSAGPSIERLCGRTASTIPYSPALATRNRARPTTVLSSQDKELKEIAEIKKFKIKANPVNRKVLGPMKPIHLEKKPSTEIVEFNITQVAKKFTKTPQKENREFRAKPMPVLKSRENIISKSLPIQKKTLPITPQVLKRQPAKCVAVKQLPLQETKSNYMPKRTVPQPFSFEGRNKLVIAKKELLIRQEIEAERKRREFHANPIRKNIFQAPSVPVKLKRGAGSTESLKSIRSDDGNAKFKARPPISTRVEPFIPKKSDRPLTEISAFDLNSERRVRERREFDEKMKERERQQEEGLKIMKELERLKEEKLLQERRKQCEHKAQPIRRFKDVVYVEPRPVTVPKTPRFIRREKENLTDITSISQ